MLELRVTALLVLAAYLFSLDGFVLSQYNISVLRAFGYQHASTTPRNVANNMALIWVGGCMAVFLQSLLLPDSQTRILGIVTLSCVIAIILRQQRLRRVLSRVVRGQVSSENRLGDILVSDGLVSLAPVLADITLSVFLTVHKVPVGSPLNRAALATPFIPLTASIPSVIRIKQCFGEYRSTKNKQHMLNLLKYAIGNAPNAIRTQIAVLDRYEGTTDLIRQCENRLFYVLILSALYSFTWDVVMDWKLGRIRTSLGVLRLPLWSYYLAFVTDLVLRFAFLAAVPYEHVVFTLQMLEISRRAMWVLFRVESEPPELEDIELH